MTTTAASEPPVQVCLGEVLHARQRPRHYAFRHNAFFMRLRMDVPPAPAELPAGFGWNRRGWLSFHDADHGTGQGRAIDWLHRQLAAHGLRADGPIWLHCFPRVLGYAFKPVSFWFCHAADERLVAVVCEVNNTFGERHTYVLHAQGAALKAGELMTAGKSFHVSPFFGVSGHYHFRFMQQADRHVARVEHRDDHGLLLSTSLSGRAVELTDGTLRQVLWSYPLFTIGVIVRIHLHALQLWLRRIPFFSKPPAPVRETTAGGPVRLME